MANQTFYFYLVTFSKNIEERSLSFVMFFLIYMISIIWNITIFIVIFLDQHLHTPMYFFLRNLSLVDMSYTTVALCKIMDVILTGDNRISYIACLAQLYFLNLLAYTEIFLLTTMSYDRYIAICHPLHYELIMKIRRCLQIVAGCWMIGGFHATFATYLASTLDFCQSRDIHNIVCDFKSLTMLSCGLKNKFESVIYLDVFLLVLCPFSLILISYGKIISNIMKVHSTGQRIKTFSTCSSHLMVLLLFYGPIFCMYFRPASENSEKIDFIFSLFYLAVSPTLNPLIYSLRNKNIKDAIRKKNTFKVKFTVNVVQTSKGYLWFIIIMYRSEIEILWSPG